MKEQTILNLLKKSINLANETSALNDYEYKICEKYLEKLAEQKYIENTVMCWNCEKIFYKNGGEVEVICPFCGERIML
jgi:DNA-directed RNA polymerase subunit RPC12/RpoP